MQYSLLKCNLPVQLLDHLPVLSFLGGSEGKASSSNVGDPGLITGSGRSPGEGNGNLLQCPYLENPTDRGTWQSTARGVAKSQTQLLFFQHQKKKNVEMSEYVGKHVEKIITEELNLREVLQEYLRIQRKSSIYTLRNS